MGHLVVRLSAAACAVLFVAAVAEAQERPDARIRVERVEGGTMLVRDIVGDYSQHPKVFADLMRLRDRDYATIGDCFGIYPLDPDAVGSPAELRWSVGVRVAPRASQKALQRPSGGYRLQALPAVEAAVIDTRVDQAATDGLAVIRWMVENGYVQVAPTRMEYRSHDGSPMLIPARIIVPVKKRPSGLKLSR